MIPVKLTLRNFMCYGDQASSLDFSGIHLACLAGDNGHGKSAIIDALTWALWGKARVQRDDALIHLGARDMEVDFEFLLANNHYRVLRERHKNGSRGRTSLEFQILDDDGFRALTGNTVRQTQATITDTLHMDYETFINSAFLLQGRADEFTAHPPAERKRILGEILDLSQYDKLEGRAKERARESEVKLREIGAALAEIEKDLSRKLEYEREMADAEQRSSQLRQRLLTEEGRLQDLREQRRELQLRRDQLQGLASQQQKLASELSQMKKEIERAQNRVCAYQNILDEAKAAEEGYAALVAARETEEGLSRKLTQQARLVEERAELRRAIDRSRNQLSVERERQVATVAALQQTLTQAKTTEKELEQVRTKLALLSERKQEREKLLEQEVEISNQMASLRDQNQQLRSDMDQLRDKLDLLEEADATCPLCGSELQVEEREHIQQSYAAEGGEKGNLYRQNSASIKNLEESLEETRHLRERADADLADLASLQGEETSLSRTLESLAATGTELEEAKDLLKDLDHQLEGGDFAHDHRQRLVALEREIEAIGYDADRHEEVRRVLSNMAPFEKRKRDLDTAAEGKKAEQERLLEREQGLENLQRNLHDSSQQTLDLDEEVARLEEATKDLENQAHLVEGLQKEDADAQLRLGAARQKLDHCTYLEGEQKQKTLEEREAKEEKTIFDELRLAFGKKGVQAMIIEAVIPEIEEEANRLLARMTDGRLNVRLKSQRETLQGKAVETLDIEVADELGPRSYSLFSGGEAFRINFAIRVALSKLLARRAGARLQTLIVDEGFGTQDAQGRERLVEAIGSIQEDFERILVITHIEELKDAFPVRIDVFKTPQGSQISVV